MPDEEGRRREEKRGWKKGGEDRVEGGRGREGGRREGKRGWKEGGEERVEEPVKKLKDCV